MKIALISDIHANSPALDAVLRHAQGQGVERVWNLGDLLGYGPFPEQTLDRIRAIGAVSIIGNYDLKVLKVKRKISKWRKKKHPLKALAFEWAFDQLSRESLSFLRSLPKEIQIQEQAFKILMTHGSPASNSEHLSPSTPEKRLRELARMVDADLILTGHSHIPFFKDVDSVRFINPGSVGRPDDGDPRCSYAILYFAQHGLEVEHYRLAYDVEETIRGVREAKLPEAFTEMFRQGRSLDSIQTNLQSSHNSVPEIPS
jgi:putative phosphoesterase